MKGSSAIGEMQGSEEGAITSRWPKGKKIRFKNAGGGGVTKKLRSKGVEAERSGWFDCTEE